MKRSDFFRTTLGAALLPFLPKRAEPFSITAGELVDRWEDIGPIEIQDGYGIASVGEPSRVIFLDPKDGDDANDGYSSDTAKQSFNAAYDLLHPGGTISLHGSLTISGVKFK